MTPADKAADPADASPLAPAAAGALAGALTVAVFALSWLTPPNVVVAILFGVPLVVAAWTRSARAVWALAGVMAVMNLARLAAPNPIPGTETFVLVNRLLVAVALAGLAGVLHVRMRARRVLERQRAELERQNDELDLANQELARREEENVRQNE